MRKLYLSTFFLFILLCPSENFGQNQVSDKSLSKPFLWNYALPDNDNIGPMDVSVSGTYYFVREIIGNTIRVNVNYKIDKMTFMPKYGDLRYKYKGKVYKANEVAATDGLDAMIGWRDVKITGINIAIKAVGVKNARWFDINSHLAAAVDIGEVDRDKDLNNLSLELVGSYATSIYFGNSIGLETRLDKMMRLVENREEYKNYIADGNNDFNNGNLENAKATYQKALKLFPKDSYAQSQIAKIDAQIKSEIAKKQATETAAVNTKSTSKTSSYNSSQDNTAHNNASRTNSYTSNAKEDNQSNVGSSQLSDKVKLSNGESVQVFRQGGKNYIQYADGKTAEINQTNYDAIQSTVNKNATKRAAQEANEKAARELQIAQNKANEEEFLARKAAREAREALTIQVATQAAGLAGELLNDWQVNRERRWAQERAQEESRRSGVAANKIAYTELVSSTNQYLFKNKETYLKMLELGLPNLLSSEPISWEEIIGTNKYNKIFGKKKTKKIADTDFDPIELPSMFSDQKLKEEKAGNEFYYWVKNDFYSSSASFIYNQNNICSGIKFSLATDRSENQVHIKDYYDDLKHNLKSRYIMLDGNTFATYDKIFILKFESLTIFDLNFLDANTSFNLPKIFGNVNSSDDKKITIDQLGIEIQSIANKGVEIVNVVPNSIEEKYALESGDIIEEVNDVKIKHPYHLQWYFYAFPNEKSLKLNIKRQNKTQTISINI